MHTASRPEESSNDLLRTVFLPLTAVYVLRREFFSEPWRFGVAGFAVLADLDKFLGSPGLLHSLLTQIPICTMLLAIEYG